MSTVRRLGVYGGSFDPIHDGHLVPVEEARRRLGIDEILFVPAFAPPHKPSGTSASSHHRFAMTALAIAAYQAFRISDFEVARGGTTYTIETLRHLKARWPEVEIVLVIGSDSFATFETWRSWREIVENHRLAIVVRDGFSRRDVEPRLSPDLLAAQAPDGTPLDGGGEGARVFWGGNTPVTISSTWIRRAVPAGEKLPGVPPPVEEYLRRQRLYLPL